MSQKKGESGFSVKDRRSGFALIDNALIDDYGPQIGAYGIAAYCILVRFARADGTDSYPSYQKVADLMGTSRRTAIRAIKKLTELGLIEKEGRRSKGESLSNAYILVNITKAQERQEVGSAPQSLPSAPQSLPSAPQSLPSAPQSPGSAPQSPDQYTITIHHNNTPLESSSIDPRVDDDEKRLVKTLSNALQQAGIGINQAIFDQYMELVANYGLHAVLSGLHAAVENNKQQKFKYVAACVANAVNGTRPVFAKKEATNGANHSRGGAQRPNQPVAPENYTAPAIRFYTNPDDPF